MRSLLLALPFLLAACSPGPSPDNPETSTATAATSAEAETLVGVWREVGKKRTLDGTLVRTRDYATLTWTFRPDGTAYHFQQFDQGEGTTLTEDHTWTLNGSNLVLHNAASGDERWHFEIVERGDDHLTLFSPDRNDHYVLERE